MKISYYELLGMIKENKQPNKVVYADSVYIWNSANYKNKNNCYIISKIDEINMFNKDITILEPKEIIEEEKEIEELLRSNVCYEDIDNPLGMLKAQYEQSKEEICDKINELIKEVNKLKKKGK